MRESNNECRDDVSNGSLLLKDMVIIILKFQIVSHLKAISLQSVIHPKY